MTSKSHCQTPQKATFKLNSRHCWLKPQPTHPKALSMFCQILHRPDYSLQLHLFQKLISTNRSSEIPAHSSFLFFFLFGFSYCDTKPKVNYKQIINYYKPTHICTHLHKYLLFFQMLSYTHTLSLYKQYFAVPVWILFAKGF